MLICRLATLNRVFGSGLFARPGMRSGCAGWVERIGLLGWGVGSGLGSESVRALYSDMNMGLSRKKHIQHVQRQPRKTGRGSSCTNVWKDW
jgi:hypothetical protein